MEEGGFRKRKRAEANGNGRKKAKKGPKKLTPLQKFRRQTLDRKKLLKNQIKENNRELRQIIKDLGVIKR